MPVILADLLRPLQHLNEFFDEDLLGRQGGQTLAGGRLKVDRDAVGQLHGTIELVIFDAGHDFEVDVTPVALSVADDIGGIDDFILRRYRALDDAGREEKSIDFAGAFQRVEGGRHFVGREGDSLGLRSPGAEDAVIAVAFAGGGHHRLHHSFGAAGGAEVGDAVVEVELLFARAALSLSLGAVAGGFVQGNIAHLRELGQGFGDETASHAPMI